MQSPPDSQPSRAGAVRRRTLLTSSALALGVAAASPARASGAGTSGAPAGGSRQWRPKDPPLSTPWTDQVGPDHALPEYPRPQMTRERWQNLNGVWEYGAGALDRGALDERVLVPYPPESALSGIGRRDEAMTYRRTFEVPEDWRDDRVFLRFGAVDQTAAVSVNGRRVVSHEGGYTGFGADITDALADGENELLVEVEDRVERAPFPVGKQRTAPEGITYTGASGIWQTVWLEPVPESRIEHLEVTPRPDFDDPSASALTVRARTAGSEAERVELSVADDAGAEVARTTGNPDEQVRVPLPDPRLWTPDDPFRYGLAVRLFDTAGDVVDEVRSYAGMRSIALVEDERGRPRIALNGAILFQHGPLDQGYWPDGSYTAPTDEALRFDLEQTKDLGFNMTRKHVKVEPARWYYWADRIGLLVWQDIPSLSIDLEDEPGQNPPPTDEAKAHFERLRAELVDQLAFFPSIVCWVPFNEGWGEFDTARIAADVREQDPTRLVDASSGVNCCYSLPDTGAGDIYDDHTYVGPGTPAVTAPRASVDGEYGGLGLVVDGHVWPGEPNAYEMTRSREELTRRHAEVHDALAEFTADNGLSASVYTQITDVENEVNGLFTYDRALLKPDRDSARERNRAVIDAGTP